jgi:hypothetical protein
MNRHYGVSIGLILIVVAAASCGTDSGTTSPNAMDGVLLRASDLSGMRLEREEPAPDAKVFADMLGGGESCACPTIFKDDGPVASGKLQGFGFKRGYRELWSGAGVHGSAFAVEFDTADHAKAALDYMNSEMLRECIDEPYCTTKDKVADPKIPNFVGLAITPLRPANEGRRAPLYKFLFRVGTSVYGVMDGASNGYDPGSVSKAQALALVEQLYARVKNQNISEVLRSAPTTPLGPPIGPPPEGTPSPAP